MILGLESKNPVVWTTCTVSLTVKYQYNFSQRQKTGAAEPEILSTRAFETKVKSFITSQETLHKEHYNGNDVHI